MAFYFSTGLLKRLKNPNFMLEFFTTVRFKFFRNPNQHSGYSTFLMLNEMNKTFIQTVRALIILVSLISEGSNFGWATFVMTDDQNKVLRKETNFICDFVTAKLWEIDEWL